MILGERKPNKDALQTDWMTPEEVAEVTSRTESESDKERLLFGLGKGTLVGKYRIIREIGRGGQGKVYLAEDTQLGRQAALKTVTAGALFTQSAMRRFKNEARAVANVRSPNIVQLYEVFEEQGVPFLAMEYVEGDTLLANVNKGILSHRDIVEIIAQCGEAMGEAHRRGLIHRDLKPQNIMLTQNGRPKIMDFGLAKNVLTDSGYSVATLEGQVIGSPAYMSPEQASGESIGPRSDVFALGTVLYQCLSRKLPHQADTPVETIYRVINEEAKPLMSLDPSINDDLNAICMKALEKSPERRYSDAGEFAADLRRWLRNEPVLARRAGVTYRVGKALKRNSDMAMMAGVAATFLAVALSASLWLFASQSTKQVSAGLQSELKTVANTAALMFDKAEMESVIADAETPDDAFESIVLRLNDVRRRNPRVENVYLFKRSEKNELLYVADADAFIRRSEGYFEIGRTWEPRRGSIAAKGFGGPVAEKSAITRGWNECWTGYAPVTDHAGAAVGLLAVEVGAKEIETGMRPVVRTSIQLGAIAGFLFFGFTGIAGFRVLRGSRRTM